MTIIISKDKLSKADSLIGTPPVVAPVETESKSTIKGAGDLIEKALSPLTKVFPKLKGCGGCKDRKDKLNKLIPIG